MSKKQQWNKNYSTITKALNSYNLDAAFKGANNIIRIKHSKPIIQRLSTEDDKVFI